MRTTVTAYADTYGPEPLEIEVEIVVSVTDCEDVYPLGGWVRVRDEDDEVIAEERVTVEEIEALLPSSVLADVAEEAVEDVRARREREEERDQDEADRRVGVMW